MNIIQIIFIIFSIFAFSRVYMNIKEKNLKGREAFFWLVFWGAAVLVLLYPGVSTFTSNIFGVERGADFIIYLAIILLAYMIFRLYAKLTHLERNITKIIRTIAIRK